MRRIEPLSPPPNTHTGAFRTAQGEQSNVKIQVMSRYKFGLAIENTRDPDYITEKVFEVLEAGAVPVYLGAPNWRDLLPLEHAIIDAAAFDSPHELADFLEVLAADDARYQLYHSWRTQPLPDRVRELEQTSFTNNLCNVCRYCVCPSVRPPVLNLVLHPILNFSSSTSRSHESIPHLGVLTLPLPPLHASCATGGKCSVTAQTELNEARWCMQVEYCVGACKASTPSRQRALSELFVFCVLQTLHNPKTNLGAFPPS